MSLLTVCQIAIKDQESKTAAVAKENALLKQQLKKYVSEAKQVTPCTKTLLLISLQLKQKNVELLEAAASSPTSPSRAAPAEPEPVSQPPPAAPEAPKPSERKWSVAATATAHYATAEQTDSFVIGSEVDDDIAGFQSIEDMQQHHERQILTLAQMHSELIELNERLQVSFGQHCTD